MNVIWFKLVYATYIKVLINECVLHPVPREEKKEKKLSLTKVLRRVNIKRKILITCKRFMNYNSKKFIMSNFQLSILTMHVL